MDKSMQRIVVSLSTTLLLIFVLVMLVIYASTTFGWFSSNSQVGATGMGVSVDDTGSFDVGVGASPNVPPGLDVGDAEAFCELIKEGLDTSIEEIAPGDFGKISFDIVTSGAVNNEYTIGVSVLGLLKTTYELCDDATINNLLCGHILFFENRSLITGSNQYHYANHISSTFTYRTAGRQYNIDETGKYHYTVEIYWVWPRSFSQLALTEDDSRVRGKAIFSDSYLDNDLASGRSKMISYIAANSQYFFTWPSPAPQITYSSGYENTNYMTLTNGYNNGDQAIGDTLEYIIVHLNMS